MTTSMLNHTISLCDTPMHPEWHLAALLVRGGSVLSRGFARVQNEPTSLGELPQDESVRGYGLNVHAEMDAVARCSGSTNGAILYVARKTPGKGEVAMSRPCDNCMPNIVASGIKKVIYTINPEQYGVIRIGRMLNQDPRSEQIFNL